MGDEDTEDAGTIYSAATSIDLPHSQQYIAELCSDIFSKLENHFDSTNWNTLEKALPSLIKAFAIKIGHDSSVQVNQDIMYFIHKQHNGIISHLKTMFCCEDDGQPPSGQRGPKGMSLLDKMSMWDNKAGEIDTVNENDELFEGVGDDDDEIVNEVGLSKYHGVILKGPSYEWLLSSLRKEFSLQWGSRQPRIMVENIRQKILDKLPAGTISKRRPLSACEVTFNLQLDDNTDRGNGVIAKLMTLEILLSELVAVTGCQEESQALTIEQYLRQTWPTYGLKLLDVLQSAIASHYREGSVTLPDNTQLNARTCGSHLTVTAIGPAQFIAECAEQLAWLQAALLCNSINLPGYYVPSIENYRVETTHSHFKQLKYRGRCDVAARLTPLVNPTDVIPQKQSCQQDLVRKGTVQGFPISRRPEAYPGLELSFELLLLSIQTNGAIIDDGLVLLKGPISTLQLFKDTNDVFLWQSFHPRNGICSCGEHHMEISWNIPYSSFDLRRLKSSRHIIGVCKDLLTTIAENSEGVGEKLSLPEIKYVQRYTSRGIGPSGNLQNAAYNLNAKNPNEVLSAPPEFQDDESLDSDMHSISDASEQFELPKSNAAINAFIDDVVNNLLSGFRSTTQCQFSQAPSGNRGQSTTQAAATGPSPTSGNLGRSRKKRCPADDDDDADQDGFRKPPNKKTRHGPDKGPQISFACPYLKMDPVRHGKCCANQLSRIRDVKRHLARVHTPDRYCQRCLETDFRSDEALDEHLDLRICLRDGSRSLEGISNKQQRELKRKSKTGIGEEEQWFKIWEILFYTRPRPSSVYMDTELSVQLRLFKEYCDTRESDVVGGLYEADPVWSGESTAEQRRAFVQMVFVQGMNRVFEDYRLSLRNREQSGDGVQPTQSEAPLSSFADSGIVVGSQASPPEVLGLEPAEWKKKARRKKARRKKARRKKARRKKARKKKARKKKNEEEEGTRIPL
ncbi:hypothetical protein VE03_10408 [Pseudogymnoascus sp. 23342-1-I1]|nr:hypothetical protein VE03_10408 [Pseudogymnoascus sp. 23342-1-I1]